MMIPLWQFADGVICHPKHLGVHESPTKICPIFAEEWSDQSASYVAALKRVFAVRQEIELMGLPDPADGVPESLPTADCHGGPRGRVVAIAA